MSIALERSNLIEGAGFIRGIGCIPIYEPPEIAVIMPGDRRFLAGEQPAAWQAKVREEESSSSSSSIGRNSDSSGSDDGVSGEAEVQSRYKGPLDSMDSLEDTLPIRRGISKFYRGKSKSFTSLADVSPSSKDLAKLVNSYTRKRKNLLAFGRHHNRPMRSNGGTKRPANTSRSMLHLAMDMSSSDSNSNGVREHEPSRLLLPPLHPKGKVSSPLGTSPPQKSLFSMRSFSLTDLQGSTA